VNPDRDLGMEVTVTGNLMADDTIHVDKIAALKM
jgi:hypothetical protein